MKKNGKLLNENSGQEIEFRGKGTGIFIEKKGKGYIFTHNGEDLTGSTYSYIDNVMNANGIVMTKGMNGSKKLVHISDYMPEDDMDESSRNNKRMGESEFQNDRYYLTVDTDERGEYGATLYNYDDEVVWDCDTETASQLIEDGFLKYKPDQDLDRLAKYLSSNQIIPRGSSIDDEKQDMDENRRIKEHKKSKRMMVLENRLRAVIRPIVRGMLSEGNKAKKIKEDVAPVHRFVKYLKTQAEAREIKDKVNKINKDVQVTIKKNTSPKKFGNFGVEVVIPNKILNSELSSQIDYMLDEY